jgi:hypothetical protein
VPDPADPAALLAGIRERYEYLGPLYQNTHFMLDAVVQDVPLLLDAVQRALKQADDMDEAGVKAAGRAEVLAAQGGPAALLLDGRSQALRGCAGDLREAITAALSGTQLEER